MSLELFNRNIIIKKEETEKQKNKELKELKELLFDESLFKLAYNEVFEREEYDFQRLEKGKELIKKFLIDKDVFSLLEDKEIFSFSSKNNLDPLIKSAAKRYIEIENFLDSHQEYVHNLRYGDKLNKNIKGPEFVGRKKQSNKKPTLGFYDTKNYDKFGK